MNSRAIQQIICALLLAIRAFAQMPEPLAEKWLSRVPGSPGLNDTSTAIAVDHAGDVYVAGIVTTPTAYRGTVLKLAGSTGALVWRWESPGTISPNDSGSFPGDARIAVCPDGNPVVLIRRGDGLVKLNANDGSLLWVASATAKGYSTYALQYEMAVDLAGDIVVVGNGTTAAIAKIRGSDGIVLWLHKPVGSTTATVRAVQINAVGDVFVTGLVTLTWALEYQTYTAKLSGTTGAAFWTKIEPLTPVNNSASGRLLQIDPSGDPIIATFNKRLLKYRGSDGTSVWEQSLPGEPIDLLADSAGDVYAAMRTSSPQFLKVGGASGSVLWGASGQSLTAMTIALRGNELIAMGSSSSRFSLNAFNTQTGGLRWFQSSDAPGASTTLVSKALTLMAQRPDGDIVLTGAARYSADYDITVARFAPGPSVRNPRSNWILPSRAELRVDAAGNGVLGTLVCEYGPTTAYGRTTATQNLASMFTPPGLTYNFTLEGLEDNTLYHARFVATTARGTTATSDFTFTTGWDANGDGLPDEWELANWGNTFFRSANSDEDRDGLKTLVEYAFGTNPRLADSAGALPIVIDQDDRLSITLPKRPHVTLHVEVGGDFKTWSPAEVVHEDETTITARDFVPRTEALGRFLRVRAASQ